jgi:alpha-mannosidase
MQFGVARRPTHYTTRYDLAKFEVPGHKWADLSEHGFGVSLLTDCKYGYSTFANEMRISLLRASKYPDAQADIGQHKFRYALYPHTGGWQDGEVVAQGLAFNVPLLWSQTSIESLFELDTRNLVLDTVKLAEREHALILRLYEAHGGRGRARLRLGVAASRVARANLLEDELDGALVLDDQVVEIDYRPHEIVTLLIRK